MGGVRRRRRRRPARPADHARRADLARARPSTEARTARRDADRLDGREATGGSSCLDDDAFLAVRLAKAASARQASSYPAVFNAANEQAVDAFHDRRSSRHRRHHRQG
ncbi:hypothetical protein [Humibacter ginsenosidimutans]|uniref:hypothetical protein n=1 Tax=Humibacter ginsenosidimutans TaxID=2599293 RepID=UPI001FEECF96|nr:hypothetical protein [Humibacter ginsenosidimutans]